MLDLKYVRENLEEAEARLRTRGPGATLSGLRDLDDRRRNLLQQSESLKAERNRVSKVIGQTKDKSDPAVKAQMAEMQRVSQEIKRLDEELGTIEEELNSFLLTVPNFPSRTTPVGTSESDNVEV